MTGEWTARERRLTSTSVTSVHVITRGDSPQRFSRLSLWFLLSMLHVPPVAPITTSFAPSHPRAAQSYQRARPQARLIGNS